MPGKATTKEPTKEPTKATTEVSTNLNFLKKPERKNYKEFPEKNSDDNNEKAFENSLKYIYTCISINISLIIVFFIIYWVKIESNFNIINNLYNKNEVIMNDITEYLNTLNNKPYWVYLYIYSCYIYFKNSFLFMIKKLYSNKEKNIKQLVEPSHVQPIELSEIDKRKQKINISLFILMSIVTLIFTFIILVSFLLL